MIHGLTLFPTHAPFTYLLICVLLLIPQSSAGTCYGNAQVLCFSEFTDLEVLLHGRRETNVTSICQAFEELQLCVNPMIQKCDEKSRELYRDDIIHFLTQPPYNCPRTEVVYIVPRSTEAGVTGAGSGLFSPVSLIASITLTLVTVAAL